MSKFLKSFIFSFCFLFSTSCSAECVHSLVLVNRCAISAENEIFYLIKKDLARKSVPSKSNQKYKNFLEDRSFVLMGNSSLRKEDAELRLRISSKRLGFIWRIVF